MTTTTAQAGDNALAILAAQEAARDAARLRRYLLAELPRRLHVLPEHVAIAFCADAVGIAVLRHDGHLVAAVGLLADAVAHAGAWLRQRVAEIEAAP